MKQPTNSSHDVGSRGGNLQLNAVPKSTSNQQHPTPSGSLSLNTGNGLQNLMQMNAGQSRLGSLPFNSQAYNFAPSLYRPNYSQPYIPEQTGNGAQNLDPIAFLAQFGGGPQLQSIAHSHPNGGLNIFQNQQFTLPTHAPQLTGLPQNGDAPLCLSLISC